MLIKALHFLLGYIRFTVSGDFPERLFNQLAAHGVTFWDMRRDADGISACMKAADYKKIRHIKGKTRVKIRATERRGLPFILRHYKLRVGFAAGLVIYVAVLCLMSGHIWNINIVGANRLQTDEIESVLSSLGLFEGAKISSVDPEMIRTRLALEFDDIAWSSVNIEGSRATVNISETIDTKKENHDPCDLTAACDGIITAIEVTNGTTLVKLGQTVKKGDTLVTGLTEYKDGSTDIGRSSGKIYARTEHRLTASAPLEYEVTVGTEKSETLCVLSFFGIDIPLYLGSPKGDFVASKTVKRFEDNGMYIPITLTETVFFKTEKRTVTVSEETAKQMALEKLAMAECEQFENAEIVSRNVSFSINGGEVTATADYICTENIAKVEFLLIYEEK